MDEYCIVIDDDAFKVPADECEDDPSGDGFWYEDEFYEYCAPVEDQYDFEGDDEEDSEDESDDEGE